MLATDPYTTTFQDKTMSWLSPNKCNKTLLLMWVVLNQGEVIAKPSTWFKQTFLSLSAQALHGDFKGTGRITVAIKGSCLSPSRTQHCRWWNFSNRLKIVCVGAGRCCLSSSQVSWESCLSPVHWTTSFSSLAVLWSQDKRHMKGTKKNHAQTVSRDHGVPQKAWVTEERTE